MSVACDGLPSVMARDSIGRFSQPGRLENLYGRIGRNELACQTYVDAQNEYTEKDRTGEGTGISGEFGRSFL